MTVGPSSTRTGQDARNWLCCHRGRRRALRALASHAEVSAVMYACAGGRDGRVVDGGGLENHCTRKGTGGSNPSPSASLAPAASCSRCVWLSGVVFRHSAALAGERIRRSLDLRSWEAASDLISQVECVGTAWRGACRRTTDRRRCVPVSRRCGITRRSAVESQEISPPA